MNLPTFKPIRGRVILRPSVSGYKGRIAIPEMYRDAISTCMVVDCAKGIHHMIKPGAIVFVEQSFGSKYSPINKQGDFICKEANVIAVLIKGKLIPLGNTILFERDKAEKKQEGIVESISLFQHQSLFGWVRGFGLQRNPLKYEPEININSYCRLTAWDETHREIHLNGKYFLIVKPEHLLYEVCQD